MAVITTESKGSCVLFAQAPASTDGIKIASGLVDYQVLQRDADNQVRFRLDDGALLELPVGGPHTVGMPPCLRGYSTRVENRAAS